MDTIINVMYWCRV